METSHCPYLRCQPGFYRSYEEILHGFSWICIPCAKNHFKPDFGNHECKPCEGRLSIDNGHRTACIDPYKNIHVDYSSKEFYTIEIVSNLGLFIVITTLIIFIVRRNTPIVTTSDFKVSILHMSIHSVIFIVTPLTFFSNKACILKPLIFTTFHTLNIGILFIKSQKLLMAFLSKVRLTAEEIKRTIYGQIFTIVIFLLFVNSGLLISYFQQPAAILEFEDSDQLTREQLCNTYFHNTVVMILNSLVQLLCAVQAFRGRNLPHVMNDGLILMYTTFILTVSFVVCFIIVPFQNPIGKEISQCIALLVNTMVIMFLLYGQKAFLMLFHPEQNTRAYFRSQRLKGMKQDVSERIEMK